MKTLRSLPRVFLLKAASLLALLFLQATPSAGAQLPYHSGDIVTTNFPLQNRFLWTNDNGQVYTPSNTTIRLHDFEGKILFCVFFDFW
jgi:hypothetical protein